MKDNDTSHDNLDALRRKWQGLRVDADRLDTANRQAADNMARENPAPLQQRLARRHSRTALVGLLLVPMAYVLYATLEIDIWVCVGYAVFGLVMSVLNRLLADYISERPLAGLPVAEAVRRAVLIRLRQRQIRGTGIVLGLGVLTMLAVTLFDAHGSDILLAMALGLCAGLAVAIPRAVKMARLARRLVDSLHD